MQRPKQEQVTFSDIELERRAVSSPLLDTISSLVDFSAAEATLGASYSGLGRPAHRTRIMLRIMILQHLYGLSDPQAEHQLADRLSFQRFVGLRAQDSVPDETAICRFRQRLIDAGLHESLLVTLNQQLEAAGYLVRKTTLVDATLVESSRKRPEVADAETGTAPDPDARYTRKAGKSYYGYKAHISTDGEHNLIDRAKVTGAHVDDSKIFTELIPPGTGTVYADKAYDTKLHVAWLEQQGIENGILKKGAHHIKLTPSDLRDNDAKSFKRRNIERVFAHLKTWQHYRRVRYLGLIKNQLEFTLKAMAYNLKRVAAIILAQAVKAA